jgi:hypothetical protein
LLGTPTNKQREQLPMSTIQRNVTGRRAGGKSPRASAPEADEGAKKDPNNNKPSTRAELVASGIAVQADGKKQTDGKKQEDGEVGASGNGGDAPDRRPHRPPVAGTTHISGPALCRRYGVVGMTLRRWETSDKLGFPKPRWVNNRKYWVLSEIEAWERSRASRTGTDG